jgi:dienelactone hydrolase
MCAALFACVPGAVTAILRKVTRRELLSLSPALFSGPRLASAQPAFPGVRYRDYSRCLPDYLRSLAAHAYERRNRELARLTSPTAIRRRQEWARATFWKLAGGEPQRTPLNARSTGSFERHGYRVEKIVYESRPRFHIPALLYIPSGAKPPFPAVLFQMGHSLTGKAADTYQRCCQGLVRLGFLVLAFDPMGQGERVYYPDDSGRATRLPSADDEHTVPGNQMLLVGDTATRLQVWDAVRSLDYLAAHPLADPRRIGATGQSGGGTLTMLLAAVDDRLAAAAVESGNTENVACADFNPPGSTDDAEQNLIDSGPAGFDRWDLLYPFAPKPLLIGVSDHDSFGTYSPRYIANGWEEFRRLQAVYRKLGHADRIEWMDTPLPHGLSYDSRLDVYNWFRRWLQERPEPLREEPASALEPDATLWVSPQGSVVQGFKSETPRSLLLAHLPAHTPAPLASLLRVDRPPAGLTAKVLRRVPSAGLEIEAIEVQSAPEVWAPAWLFLPAKPAPGRPLLLVAEAGGRNLRWHEDDLYQNLARSGTVVCVADVRGIGDLTPEIGRGNPRYTRPHADEENFAWASLIFGRPLVGQRTSDLLALAAALRPHPACAGRRLRLAANARLSLPALFAAALDPEIHELYLAGAPLSYRNIVETEEYGSPFVNFVPGILKHTDLAEVARSIAPRRVVLAGVVNAAGEAVAPTEVRKLYASANVEVRPRSEWNEAALAG